jgi:U3 small nucleolar RNA-associated protein 23
MSLVSLHCFCRVGELSPTCPGKVNKHRYVVATQSQSLRSSLRDIPAVPIVHFSRSVMILEPPSDATLKTKEKVSLVCLLYDLHH